MAEELIVIPDVHGRKFWREAIKGNENKAIVFLGDYLDPYSSEGVSYEDAFNEFNDILAFKKEHPDNVTLLLGNHDMGYLKQSICRVRQDYERRDQYRKLLLDDIALFDIVAIEQFGEQSVLLSHAGIRMEWVNNNRWLFNLNDFRPEVLNELFHDECRREDLYLALADVSSYRGGMKDAGSVIWADAREFIYGYDELPGYFQIFGHTLHRGGAWRIDGHLWCLDCAKAFKIGLSQEQAGVEIAEL